MAFRLGGVSMTFFIVCFLMRFCRRCQCLLHVVNHLHELLAESVGFLHR